MRNVGQRMKREWKKFLSGPLTPVVEIEFLVEVVGGTENDFNVVVGGIEDRQSIRKKCHVVMVKEASRAMSNLGSYNESDLIFFFDRDDDEITPDLWEDIVVTFQGQEYWIDPIKAEKEKLQLITLAETSMATVIVGELRV